MNELYEALEICLQQLEQGADVDSILFAYPDLADELRPILKASLRAKAMSAPAPSADTMRRSKARLLQRAAEMREAKATPPRARRVWLLAFRPVAVVLAVIFMLFASGTGLVRAASTTLPGDGLYPVKRTWENVSLWFAFNPQRRIALESEYEQERLDEVEELFSTGRSVTVIFAGRVTDLTNARWLVAGIPVAISNRTDLPDEQVNLNDAVRVTGHTRADGTVDAERLELLPQDAVLPISEMEKPEPETHETPEPREEQNSGSGSRDEAKTPESGASSQPESKSFDGKVESIQGEIWIINGQAVDVSQAEIKGVPTIGADANVKGYITVDGKFVATKIEFESESGSGSNDSGGSGSNDNGSDSGGSGSNDNGDDNGNGSGGDDNGNSGSGGGGSGSGGSNDGNGHP